MRLLGIDHGLKRIGLSVSDSSGLVAREVAIINRTTNQEDFVRLNRLAADLQVDAIVVGLPINSDAPDGAYTQADTVRRWVERFSQTTLLPIVLWDEQLTSADARAIPIDDLAARVILQSYLDALSAGLAEPPPFPHE
jgi:putative Holliday junction resolvase